MCKSLKLLSSYNSILLIAAKTFTNPLQKKEKHFMTSGHISLRRDVFKCAHPIVSCRRVEKPSNNESLTARNTQGQPDNSEM